MSALKPVVKREGPLDQALLLGISIVLGAGIVLWLTGELTGWLHSRHWPRVTAAEMGPVLVNLARHPGDPAAAWPAHASRLLPGPVAFYFVFGLLLLVLTAALMYANVAMRVVRRRLGGVIVVPGAAAAPGRRQQQPTWARPQAFRDLYVRESMPGRVTLGRINGRPVAAEPLQSVIALGPPQSHKTSGLAVPAVFEWDGPVLAASIKADLIRTTIDQRWQKGEVYLYDPTGITGLEQSSWSPLSRCGTWHGAYRTAVSLLSAGRPQSHAGEADFHHSMAPNLLAPLLLAAAISGRTMGDVVRWVQRQERAEVTAALNVANEPAAQDAMQSVWSLGDNRAALYASVLGAVSAYADPAVKEAVPATQLTAERLLDGGMNTAYVCAAAHEQRRLGPLFVALLQEVVDLAYERSDHTGIPLNPPLLVVLDDAAVSAALPQLDMLASTAANHGVQLLTTFRTITQIQSRYGERAEAVFSNHRAKILLSGITDPPTLTLLSHLLEDETLRHVAPTAPPAQEGAVVRARSGSASPAEALRRIYPGQGVLLYGHLPPAFLTLRPFFKDRRMAARSGDGRGVARRPI
ncbi:MAG TPA: type IV secretory system conjugative DNA transfer family protein [Actinomycetota bacterium]|nr:type IV secretory system conjugative DNA transfer family protein [Actinomycetota bacterium]